MQKPLLEIKLKNGIIGIDGHTNGSSLLYMGCDNGNIAIWDFRRGILRAFETQYSLNAPKI